MKIRVFVLVLATHLLSFFPARGQLAELVAELDLGLFPEGVQASVGGYVETPETGRVFFLASTPSTGQEVWTSDGSPEGTRMLGDLCPGLCARIPPAELVSLGDRIVWIAQVRDGRVAPEEFALWTSDGTPGGTELLLTARQADLAPATGAVFEGAFLFPAGDELWRTDGTAAGTFRLASSVPEASDFLEVQGELYFLTPDALWQSDGTAAGTRQVNALASFEQPRI